MVVFDVKRPGGSTISRFHGTSARGRMTVYLVE